MIENEMTVSVPLEVVKASEIEPREVKWLWYPYIPFGKVTLLQGDPGDGKSKLMLSIAALLSKGEPLPFTETEENEPVTIIYQTTEDDADDTVVPRFNSAGGNGENLIFIREDEKSLSFGDNRIREAIEMYHAKLLILDPMSSYIGEICSMNNANETRAEFNHLIAVAKDTGCAIVIIAHMNKMRDTNPLYQQQLVLPDIVFQITQTRFVVINKRLRVFCIGKADNIAVLGFMKADKARKPCHLRNLDQGVVIILAVVYV